MTDTIINSPTINRPQNFTEIVGQPFVKGLGERLGDHIISGQGYILSGPKGCGKTTTARIIAKSLNCKDRDKHGNPCNQCKSCQLIKNNANPLVKEINAASIRGIDAIRQEVLNTMNYSVSEGYRVYILDEIHQLTRDAFSLLLKPMEEPPENVIFIATTTNLESIPETIQSRVPIVPILPLSDKELEEVLYNTIENGKESGIKEWGNAKENDIKNAIMSAQGSARQAITNLSGIVFHGVSVSNVIDKAHTITESFRNSSLPGVLSSAQSVLNDKESDPTVIITTIINDLTQDLMNNNTKNPVRTSYQIASLALVANDLTISSQPQIVAAKIAACIHKDIDDGAAELIAEMSKNKGAKIMKIKNNSEQKIIAHLFSDSSYNIIKDWFEVLDDENKSNIYKSNDKLIVEIREDNKILLKDLKKTLSKLFDKVEVRDKDVFS